MTEADGIILGSPVYSANISATMQAFLERAAVVCDMNPGLLKHKVGASVVAARRGSALNAIDSVGADFLMNEPTVVNNNSALKDNSTVENYLHEAGLIANAPSGTAYTNGNGKKVTNAGVHEHWNNSTQKQYSRNLGKTEGIELIYIQ